MTVLHVEVAVIAGSHKVAAELLTRKDYDLSSFSLGLHHAP
jgi:hypothetical protein